MMGQSKATWNRLFRGTDSFVDWILTAEEAVPDDKKQRVTPSDETSKPGRVL